MNLGAPAPLPASSGNCIAPTRVPALPGFMVAMRFKMNWGLSMNRPIEPQRNEGAQRSQLCVPSFLCGFSDGSWSQCASDCWRCGIPMNPVAARASRSCESKRTGATPVPLSPRRFRGSKREILDRGILAPAHCCISRRNGSDCTVLKAIPPFAAATIRLRAAPIFRSSTTSDPTPAFAGA